MDVVWQFLGDFIPVPVPVKPISTSPNDVFPSLLVVGFRIWSRVASLRTAA